MSLIIALISVLGLFFLLVAGGLGENEYLDRVITNW